MKYFVIAFLLGILYLPGKSQTTYTFTYSYDAAGNRESRSVATAKLAAEEAFAIDDSTAANFLSGVRVFPNPTDGLLELKIVLENNQEVQVQFYNLQGQLMLEENLAEGNLMDIASFPAGQYLMRIQAGDKERIFKIIKK